MRTSAKSLKRKVKPGVTAARKKTKTEHLTANDLPWKMVKSRQEAGLHTELEGMMELEEVDGVEVVYEEGSAGRVATFRVSRTIVLR